MPTYQYVCTSCDEPHEAVQAFTDDALTDCPACDDGRLRKVFGSVGVVFKGSGFYRTDSRDAKSSTSATKSGGDSSGSSSTATSSDSGSSSSSSSGASGSAGTSGSSGSSTTASKAPAPSAS